MSDVKNSSSTEEKPKQKTISTLIKEISACFHREIKKQKRTKAPSRLKKRISKEDSLPPE